MNKKAFTLAEVVVAVAIIGAIAALTIPTFLSDNQSQRNQYAAGLKKAYSDLSYATDQIKANNAGVVTGSWSSSGNANDNLRNLYSRTLKFTQLCDAGAAHTNCWPANYFQFNGNANGLDLSNFSMAVLNDGAMITFHSLSTTCADASVRDTSNNNIGCGEIYIDVNGTRNPNRFGRDIFQIYISRDKIVPNGDTGTAGTNCPTNGGLECAAKVLTDGRMVY